MSKNLKSFDATGLRIPSPGLTPSLSAEQAQASLNCIYNAHIANSRFSSDIRKLQRMFSSFAASAPPPWPARGLKITPEINYQSQLWLPMEQIKPIFYKLYRNTLLYPPVYGSTPFSKAASWASLLDTLPDFLNGHTNPVTLLSLLLDDDKLRKRFIFWSFMPSRFYGNFSARYPQQWKIIGQLAPQLREEFGRIDCLDAACGDGEGTYGLARTLLEHMQGKDFSIEGWTLDPLEVWSAAYAIFPHSVEKERLFRAWIKPVYQHKAAQQMRFRQANLLTTEQCNARFHLIICNGLLGGPIINEMRQIEQVAARLASLLLPGGYLIIDDNFHGGWEKKIPAEMIRHIFEERRLKVNRDGSAFICRK